MKPRLQSCDIHVDDRPMSPLEVYCFPQDDPYPGTSRYRLVLRVAPGNLTARYLEHLAGLPTEEWLTPGVVESRQLLGDLEGLIEELAAWQGRANPYECLRYRYFLNSITRIVRRGDVITAEGICSPIGS